MNHRIQCKVAGNLLAVALFVLCRTAFGQNQPYDPDYHFYPSIDPTGLFYYDGKYFLNWGSATSIDLVHWKMTDFGLDRNDMTNGLFGKNRSENSFAPDSPFRNAVISMMSGTAVIDHPT